MGSALRGALGLRPIRLYAAGMVLANAIGAVIVFVLVRFVLPLPVDAEELLSERNYWTFAVYLPTAIVLGGALGIRTARPLIG